MINIGIIGCGKQAAKHILSLRGNVENISLFDINQEAAIKLAKENDLNAVSSVKEIIENPNIHGVIIATPTLTHYELILDSLNAKKHVFCEKPLCENLEQANILNDVSLRTGYFVQVGYVYRQVPAFKELHKLINLSEKPLGGVILANLKIGGRGDHNAWKHKKSLGGGAINEMLVHMLDLVNWLFGDITDVNHCNTHLLRSKRIINGITIDADAEDFVSVAGFTRSGVYVTVQADLLTPAFSQSIEVQGENGSFFGSIQANRLSEFYLINSTNSYQAGKHQIVTNKQDLFHNQMNEFIVNIKQNKLNQSPGIKDSIQLVNILQQVKDFD
ncbi:myo-inositol 2-dehydrogenase [Legionella beliardensis]|uniref:Myo-inositol 2-dehydrogenase n=1 Tax=Legionella beliardensis TaxID=91822 RepID=A0A378I2I4_9GAMM|nr:Gfo/Idh/MocA family oxidoreductase [Legionella beliardensis]STX28911.1 myo-inositol 2-dehydrogenase [Legionella beliardensis]